MKALIFISILALAKARVVTNNECNGVIVKGIAHTKQVLLDGYDSPYQLAIDYDTNTLFFSYSANTNDAFKSVYYNLKTDQYGPISGISGGFANAVDSKTHTVYLGGRDGVYKYNFDTKTATDLKIISKSIWQLFYKDNLYISTYPNEEAYIYKDGAVKRLPELADTKALLVAIDNERNIFFSNTSGLFYKKPDGTTVQLGDYVLNGFTNDLNGKLYFSTPSGIFAIDDSTKKVETLALIDNVYGIAIEGDYHIICAIGDSVVRLLSTGKECVSELSAKSYDNNNL